jgi:rhamnosyltransferase
MTINEGGVWAVVVTYRPELNKLGVLLDSLACQVNGVVVVDNGSSQATLSWLGDYQYSLPLQLVALGDNKGIAAAQNVGIQHAMRNKADYVILFDHDSHPETSMVAKLREVAEAKLAAGVKLAAVGPRYLDERHDNPPPFIQVRGLKVERQPCINCDSVVEVDYLIASGCLIPIATLALVGHMHEELFIDYVDIEWGLRAKTKGYQSFGACAAQMDHDLGDEPFEFLGKKYPHHSALRHYYHFRNAIWMYRQGWLPWHWKLADGWRLFLKYGFYTLFAKPRPQHWWMMTKGIWHGLTGRMGRLN